MTVPLLRESADIVAAREKWQFTGVGRPDFADRVNPGERSVWDFPRPPIKQSCGEVLEVRDGELILARTTRGVSVLETGGAPTYYFPPEDVRVPLAGDGGSSICEWKGLAESLSAEGLDDIGWRYIAMFPAFADIYRWVSFYPSRVSCYVGNERVRPQPGGYYGGWVTNDLAGPIKGAAGSSGW